MRLHILNLEYIAYITGPTVGVKIIEVVALFQ
jgi:hypothetical protein